MHVHAHVYVYASYCVNDHSSHQPLHISKENNRKENRSLTAVVM